MKHITLLYVILPMINLVLTDVIFDEEVLNQVSDGGVPAKSARSSIILILHPSYHRRNDIIFKSINSRHNMIVIHSYYLFSFMMLMIISATLFILLCCDNEPL